MHPDYWHKKWQTSDTHFHRSEVNPTLLKYYRLLPSGPLFVPLCGKTLDMDWLEKQGRKVIGVELSPIACETFFKENHRPYQNAPQGKFTVYEGENITLWCGDFFKLPPHAASGTQAIYDRAALIALSPDTRRQYAERLTQLCPNASILLVTLSYPQHQVEGPPFSVTEREVQDLLGRTHEVSLLERREEIDLKRNHPKFKTVSELFECVYLGVARK